MGMNRTHLVLIVLSLFFTNSVLAESSPEKSRCSVKRGLIILVKFPDVENPTDKQFAQKRFGYLNRYIKEMSYNKICIETDITKDWKELPQSIDAYRISPHNLEVDKSRIEKLLKDALNAVDKEVDYSTYDFVALFLAAKREEYGMVGLCGFPGMLGWSKEKMPVTDSGQAVKGVAIFSFQAHIGTLFHDVAHILGGVKDGKRMVPCLYDHDLQAQPGPLRETFIKATIYMGFWDPMSCHFIAYGTPPPGMSSWTKLRLGWIDPSKVQIVKPGETRELLLGALEDEKAETLVIKIPLSETTYYLIENRQPIGFDEYLPGHGVLIMLADDSIPECRHGKGPVRLINANPSIPDLKGAAFTETGNRSFIDEKHKVKITILEKTGSAYKLRITP
jgi:M6 family metalloprotease-like protein